MRNPEGFIFLRRHFLTPLNFATLGIDANKVAHCAHSKQNVLTFFAAVERSGS